MRKKAIIFDLDNTLYGVRTIGEEVFGTLFELIRQDEHHDKDLEKIKNEIMRRPFQAVAKQFHFSDELIQKGTELLKNLSYKGKIEPFEDYKYVRSLPVERFLVTSGFFKLQQSKIDGMKIAGDFREIHIIDASITDKTKKDVFADIVKRLGYATSEVLVVGDDPESEIKAADELGLDAVLYDKYNLYPGIEMQKINDYSELGGLLQ